MTDKQKIKILNDRIGILENENEQLESKVKKLEELMYFSSNTEKESVNRANEIFEILENKKKEYERLVCDCDGLKKSYIESVEEMHKIIGKYKKDVKHTKIRQWINGIKRKIS